MRVQSVEIVDYGIYTAENVSSERNAHGVMMSNVADIRHAVTTSTIPAHLEVRFGFNYKVVGKPGNAIVALRKVTIFP